MSVVSIQTSAGFSYSYKIPWFVPKFVTEKFSVFLMLLAAIQNIIDTELEMVH